MPQVSATVKVAAPIARVYRYLRNRYDGDLYRMVSQAAKGYLPRIVRLEDIENRRLRFRVPGRDPILPISIGSWEWCYEFESLSDSETVVTISYAWSFWMTLLTFATVRRQAGNELVETALALQALTWNHA